MLWLLLSTVSPSWAVDLPVGPAQPYLTVQDALDVAVSGDRILIDPGSYDVRALSIGTLEIEIRAASGPGTVVLRAIQGASLFTVGGGALTLVDLEVDGLGERRLAAVTGGALTVEGCSVHDTATPNPGRSGGAIDADGATIVIRGTTIDRSDSPNKPGGILSATGGTLEITDSTLRAGTANDGGALDLSAGAVLTADRVVFEANASLRGSAIDAQDSEVLVRGSTFLGNDSGEGTIRCLGGLSCTVEGSTFEGNVANRGAVLQANGVGAVSLTGSTICASTGSWAVDLQSTTALVANDVFVSNTVDEALVGFGPAATGQVINDHFVGNDATLTGSALLVQGTAELTNTLIAYASGPGVAVAAAGGTLTGGWSAYWQNLAADADVALFGTDLTGLDPLIPAPVAGSCDPASFIPPASSPLVDAGDPAIFDLDGTVSDIGAWGGGAAAPPVEPVDEDGDGWYVPADCDDTNAAVNPGVAEVACNGLDDDCKIATVDTVDADGDGFDQCTGDCDDNNPSRSEYFTVYRDKDFDGFGVGQPVTVCGMPLDASLIDGDCDDLDSDRYPGNVEIPYDGVDQDCDGIDPDDLDGDGALLADDCDDADPERWNGAPEIPDDGIDQDCSGADQSATFNGGAGLVCGCDASAPAGGVGPSLALGLLLLARRRRR